MIQDSDPFFVIVRCLDPAFDDDLDLWPALLRILIRQFCLWEPGDENGPGSHTDRDPKSKLIWIPKTSRQPTMEGGKRWDNLSDGRGTHHLLLGTRGLNNPDPNRIRTLREN